MIRGLEQSCGALWSLPPCWLNGSWRRRRLRRVAISLRFRREPALPAKTTCSRVPDICRVGIGAMQHGARPSPYTA